MILTEGFRVVRRESLSGAACLMYKGHSRQWSLTDCERLACEVTYHNVVVYGFLHGLREVQVQVHVLLFAADGVIALAAGTSCDMLP